MPKKILVAKQAREEAVEALSFIADYVSQTLGPAGRPILMTRRNQGDHVSVQVTKDGFNSIKALAFPENPVKDAVLQICSQASGRSLIASGDGTTSTIVLAAEFAKALNNTEDSYKNPQERIRAFKRQIRKAIDEIQKEAILSDDATTSVVLTSSNRDTEMAHTVISCIEQGSAYGSVLVVASPTIKERFLIQKDLGYQCGKGYSFNTVLAQSLNPSLTTGEDIVLHNPIILPFNGDVQTVHQFAKIIENISIKHPTDFTLLIIAHDVTDKAAIEMAEANRRAATFNVKIAAIKTTMTWEENGSVEQLKDIAAFSGSPVLDGGMLSSLDTDLLQQVKMVTIQPSKSFMSGKGKNNTIKKRAKENQRAAGKADSQVDKEHIESRNASLTDGLVKLTVGRALASELQEIKDRADDAIKAGQSCNRSGALPGCGASYIRAGYLANVDPVLQRALAKIHQTIMANYGVEVKDDIQFKQGEVVAIIDNEILDNENFLDVGIADSFETVKGVLENAFELGATIANLGAVCLEGGLEELENAKMLRDTLRAD